MSQVIYKTHGTCSRAISIDIDDQGCIREVRFVGGCDGNAKGICALVRGMHAGTVKDRLLGIRCGAKSTSCPDQLAKALKELGY